MIFVILADNAMPSAILRTLWRPCSISAYLMSRQVYCPWYIVQPILGNVGQFRLSARNQPLACALLTAAHIHNLGVRRLRPMLIWLATRDKRHIAHLQPCSPYVPICITTDTSSISNAHAPLPLQVGRVLLPAHMTVDNLKLVSRAWLGVMSGCAIWYAPSSELRYLGRSCSRWIRARPDRRRSALGWKSRWRGDRR